MKNKFKLLISIMLLLTVGIGQMWGDTTVDATLGTRDSISADGKTRGWNLVPANIDATTNVAKEGDIYHDIFLKPSSNGKQKFSVTTKNDVLQSRDGLSSSSSSDIYIPVPAGSAGTISMSVYSSSDSRYLQLYKTKNNTIGTDAQRLYSKYNATATSDSKKGPQSFTFSATDTTMIGDKAYLHFKDNNTEMKISGFSVVLTTGTYATSGGEENPEQTDETAPTTIFDWTAATTNAIGTDNTDLSTSTYGTLTTGTSVAGRMFGTNTIDKNNAGYKLGNNDVCIEIQGTHTFAAGDTVIITGQNGGSGDRCFAVAPSTTTNAVTDTILTNTVGSQTANSVYKAVITSKQAGTKIRIFRLAGKTMYCKSIKVIRPVSAEEANVYAVTFNMHGHGDAVAQQNIVQGGKVTEPATASISGWDFGGWYKESTYDNAWDFANDVVNAATELHAKWTEAEVADNDATLSYLEVDGESVPVPADGIYRMVAAYGHTPQVTDATTTSSGASRVIYNTPTHNDADGGFDYVQVVVTASDGETVKYYQIRYTHAPKLGVELIKATHTGGKTASVTGYIGGSADKSTQDNGKLGSNGHYFGIQLESGNFQAGDIVAIKASALNGGNTATLFTDKGTTALASGAFNTVDNMYYYTLEAEVEKIYLYRATSACNPNVEYIAVYRSMDPFIASFKFGDDAATINESAKTISFEVPYSTDVTALTPTVEAYGNNGATYTPTGAQDFTSPVNYVVTDGYSELSTTYAVIVNVATPSENAYLASLSVAGYALDFNKETTSYNIVLDYGTTTLPAITYEVEDTGLATAEKVEGGVNGATTITVTPQAGAGYEKVYTINFSVSTSPKFVIYDGSNMSDYAESGSDNGTGFAWTVTGGNHSEKSVNTTLNGKTYTKGQNIFGSPTKGPNDGNTRYITITIPEGYLAKFYIVGSSNNSNEVSLFISKEITSNPANAIACVTAAVSSPTWAQSGLQLPGTYYFCVNGSARICELSVQLYRIDYTRDVTAGNYGTICLPKAGVMAGAAIFEVAYLDNSDPYKKIFFDEVISGEMVAGRPYIFLPYEGVSTVGVLYTDDTEEAAGNYRGLYGFIDDTEGAYYSVPAGANNYIIYGNQYHHVQTGADARILSNRAYLKIGGEDGVPTNAVAPAPGRRRVSMSAQGEQVATGLEEQTDNMQCAKIIIDGQFIILRGEKMYDATGRLVK